MALFKKTNKQTKKKRTKKQKANLSLTFGKALVSTQSLLFPLTLFIKGLSCEGGKTRYLWGKGAIGGLKPESHPSNYKYRRKKYFHYVREWGWGKAG